jgi:hypothetical protein
MMSIHMLEGIFNSLVYCHLSEKVVLHDAQNWMGLFERDPPVKKRDFKLDQLVQWDMIGLSMADIRSTIFPKSGSGT